MSRNSDCVSMLARLRHPLQFALVSLLIMSVVFGSSAAEINKDRAVVREKRNAGSSQVCGVWFTYSMLWLQKGQSHW